ncbi:MAG: radical SAM protein [Firmicutes bacterium]|nr:radical SAM protein [Bacillota bacterium]
MTSTKVSLIYSDADGNLRIDPQLTAVGFNGSQVELGDETWIDFPAGGELLLLPGRLPLGYNQAHDQLEVVEEATALAAIMPLGYTRTLTPAYETAVSQELPLFGYTAVGAVEGRLKVAAIETDAQLKWNPIYYNTSDLPRLIKRTIRDYPENRILRQLSKCALEYHCLTAQNIFYRRWEAGIPVSPLCNADCLGCISKQPAECCPSPQNRIDFVPEESEIVELATVHLEEAADGIISFGQGCEGEPSLQKELLVKAVRAIRRQTSRGTININSNAGYTEAIKALADAGLDSIRVSLFSAVPEHYDWYHRPHGYTLADVRESLRYAADNNLQTALNLLFFPGFSNQKAETAALKEFIADVGVRQVQIRNMNIDPEKMSSVINGGALPTVAEWISDLQRDFPGLQIGNYTKPKA